LNSYITQLDVDRVVLPEKIWRNSGGRKNSRVSFRWSSLNQDLERRGARRIRERECPWHSYVHASELRESQHNIRREIFHLAERVDNYRSLEWRSRGVAKWPAKLMRHPYLPLQIVRKHVYFPGEMSLRRVT